MSAVRDAGRAVAAGREPCVQRLCALLGDRIGARRRRMELTPRAQRCARPLAQALDRCAGCYLERFRRRAQRAAFPLMMPISQWSAAGAAVNAEVTRLWLPISVDIVPRLAGPAISRPTFARTIELVISIGDAFRGFTASCSTPTMPRLAVRCLLSAEAEAARCFPGCASCGGGHPRPERGLIDMAGNQR